MLPDVAPASGSRAYRVAAACTQGEAVISVAVTPDGGLIAAASVDRRAYLYSREGELLWRSAELDGECWCVAISADRSTVAVGTARLDPAGGSVFVFDVSGAARQSIELGAPVWGVDLSGDGAEIAAATWANELCLLRRSGAGEFGRAAVFAAAGGGFYGVRHLPETGGWCVASFTEGVYVLDAEARLERSHPLPAGLYNVAVAAESGLALIGRGEGRVARLDLRSGKVSDLSVSRRAVCGVACDETARTVLLGGFDGVALLCDEVGRPFWRHDAGAEIWSTALSADGRVAVIGAGDGTVHIIDNAVTPERVEGLRAAEAAAFAVDARVSGVRALLRAYRALGVVEYGCRRIAERAKALPADLAARVDVLVREDLAAYVRETPQDLQARVMLADMLERCGRIREAVALYQSVVGDPDLEAVAHARSSACLDRLGFARAARIGETRPARGALLTLYNLARSYEAMGEVGEARHFHETIIAYDIDYRDVLARLDALPDAAPGPRPDTQSRLALPEVRLGWLGSNVVSPERSAASLQPVLAARLKELGGVIDWRDRLERGWRRLAAAPSPDSEDEAYWAKLASYLAYDYAPPADEIKKKLDLVHTAALIDEFGMGGRSLDIGTATGRYPGVLRRLGFQSFGVDLEHVAMRYADGRSRAGRDPVPFVVGDGGRLPFRSETFDLITCMMGTLSHIAPDRLPGVLDEIARVLRPGGHLICSTWDPGAAHLDFLAMYTPAQKADLYRNLLSREGLAALVGASGMAALRVEPYCVFPAVVGYDTGYDEDGRPTLRRLMELDLAIRAVNPETHGQLFTLLARKPGRAAAGGGATSG